MDTWVHIVGGGLSGLSLASALAKHQVLPGPVVISEPEPERLAQKTFSFWLTDEEHAILNPEHTHSNWQVSTKKLTTLHSYSLLLLTLYLSFYLGIFSDRQAFLPRKSSRLQNQFLPSLQKALDPHYQNFKVSSFVYHTCMSMVFISK